MKKTILSWAVFSVALLLGSRPPVLGQGTAFTYQGVLAQSNTPARGAFDFEFTLFDANANGHQIAVALTNTGVAITNGLFAVQLDFGANVFTGSNYWLEIGVRTNGASAFTTVSPRQSVTPSPYAIYSASAGNLAGPIANSQLANSAITINAGPGLTGGGVVPLGGSTSLANGGITAVAGNGDITAVTTSGVVNLGSTATSADTPNAIVKRDGAGNFSAANLSLDGNLNLPAVSSSGGSIIANGNRIVNTFGSGSIFFGPDAGNLTLSGSDNTAVGYFALAQLSSGSGNCATGARTLINDTTGIQNTADGAGAMYANTGGGGNVATGYNALTANSIGVNNVGVGWEALYDNTTGNYNVALGSSALAHAPTTSFNTALGGSALLNLTSGNYNIAVGYGAGIGISTGTSNIDIGNQGLSSESGVTRIGTSQSSAYVAGIYSSIVSGGTAVYVNSSGQLGTVLSSRRFKRDIEDMAASSDVLRALRPVTFRYKKEIDSAEIPQFGLIAEEVEKVSTDLVVHDAEGQPLTVRYEAVNAMVLNEVIKQQRKAEEQERRIRELATALADLRREIEKPKISASERRW